MTTLLLALAFIALSPAVEASAATGVRTFVGGQGTTGGKFGETVGGIAINQGGTGGATAGSVYVADRANNRVEQFDASGAFVRAFGVSVGGSGVDICTVAANCQAGKASAEAGGMSNPEGIAIDQASGNLFITDYGNRRIDVFSATGTFEGAFGWSVDAEAPSEQLQFCTVGTGCQAGSDGAGAGQFGQALNRQTIGGVAISPLNGHVIVASPDNRRIDEFASSTIGVLVTGVSFVRGFGWGAATGADEFQICTATCHAPGPSTGTSLGQFGESQPAGLAVNGAGAIFAPDQVFLPPSSPSWLERFRVMAFSSSGEPDALFAPNAFTAQLTPQQGIAVDEANGNVLVVRGSEQVLEINPAGAIVETYLAGLRVATVNSFLAVNEASEVIYVTTDSGFVTIGELVPPVATIEPVVNFSLGASGVSATFEGHVNPAGLETGYQFEYSQNGTTWSKIPSGEIFLPADTADHAVEPQMAHGLEGLTEYHVKLVANKIFKSGSATAETTFQTPAAPPVVSPPRATRVADVSAVIAASVNPQNQLTSYHFECVSQAQFAESGFAQAFSVPAGDEPTVEAGDAVQVSEPVGGLSPVTSYHCRLLAKNATGPVVGEEVVFTTFPVGVGALPDGRAYEQASPVQKNGNNILGEANAVQASATGERVTFFVNGGIPGGEGAQNFPTYVASRSTDGTSWGVQGLLPPASTGPAPFGNVLGWDEELDHAYDVNRLPGGASVLYQRDNTTSAFRPVVTANGTADVSPFAFAGEAEGGSTVMFEDSGDQLTPEAVAGSSNVYLWRPGTGELILASVLNNGKAPAEGAFAGPYRWFNQPSTAEGGAASLYYTQAEHAISANGDAIYFTAKGSGQIYVRMNPLARQSNISKGKCTQPERACTVEISAPEEGVTDPNGETPAAFVGATSDGTKAIFLSAAKLTADAVTGAADGGKDLYRFDAASGKLTDLTVDAGASNGAEVKGVIGMSQDGAYVYFVANGVLAPGAAPGTCIKGGEEVEGICNLYVWHEGTVTFIAPLNPRSGGHSQKPFESDVMDWAPTANRVNTNKSEATARVSTDGRTLLFRSQRNLTNYDNHGFNELYRYEVGAGVECISCSPTDAAPTGEASLQQFPVILTGPHIPQGVLTRNLSANGNRIFFNTPDQLVARDVNGVGDVYEWEAEGEGSCHSSSENGGCLYLISSGTSPEPSAFGDASSDGSNAFFFTTQPLVAQDKDELTDVYDARVGGGIPAQNAVETHCQEEGCRPGPENAPAGLGAAAPAAGGNVKAGSKPSCKRKKPKHGKKKSCVRHKHHKARHHAKRRAGKTNKHGKGKTVGSSKSRGPAA